MLQLEILEHCLNDQVDVLQLLPIGGGLEVAQKALYLFCRQAAAFDADLVVFLDDAQAAVESVFILIYKRDAKTGLSKAHSNAATHGARADNADVFDRLCLRASSHAVNLAGRSLSEKQVSQRGGLRVLHAGLKRPTLCG